jgi:hypothetical protein
MSWRRARKDPRGIDGGTADDDRFQSVAAYIADGQAWTAAIQANGNQALQVVFVDDILSGPQIESR